MEINEKKSIIKDTWLRRNTGCVPYIVEAGRHHLATLEFYRDNARELSWHESYYNKLSDVEDYNVPNIKPNVGIGTVAAALGCEYVPNEDGDPWVRPMITEENVDAVYQISKPEPARSPVYRQAFDRLDYFLEHSTLPLRLLNVPSPLVAASQVWEYTSFVEATLAHPREVHYMLEVVTQSIIEYVRLQLDRISRLYTMGHEPLFIPREVGLRISDDTAAVLSPTAYREFGVPYNRKISEAFGGLIWHSCGDVGAVLPVVMEIPGLRGIDVVAPQNDWNKLRIAVDQGVAMILRHYFWDHAENGADLVAYSRELIKFFGGKGIFILTSAPTAVEAQALAKQLSGVLT
jgi:hypothetical protein